MTRPRRDAPPPLEGNDQLITLVLTAAWLAALIVVVALADRIPDAGRWIWTCVTGIGLGLFALAYVPRIKRSRARAGAGRAPDG
jgi:peptidoglycan/LPS O-acetylase OafA/YrhL